MKITTPLDIDCKWCGAVPGEPCVNTLDNSPRSLHRSRREDARLTVLFVPNPSTPDRFALLATTALSGSLVAAVIFIVWSVTR